MNRLKGRGLQIDDPLGPGPSRPEEQAGVQRGTDPTAEWHEENAAARTRNGAAPAPPEPSGESRDPVEPNERAWREWTGLSGVGSFRLPHELLAELGDTARELQLPIGLIVTAAITKLLDQPPDEIAVLVDKADDARIQGRRRARRRVTTRSDDSRV
jgi:hypothetical protein